MNHLPRRLRLAFLVARFLTLVALMPPSIASATSGMGSYFAIEVPGGYEVVGRRLSLDVVKTADQSVVQFGNTTDYSSTKTFGEDNEEHILIAYSDSAKYLLLCSWPTSVTMSTWPSDWSVIAPFEGANILVIDKKNDAVVGPMDRVAATAYFKKNGIIFTGWLTAHELSEKAGEWSFPAVSFDFSIVAVPLTMVVTLFLLAATVYVWYVIRARENNDALPGMSAEPPPPDAVPDLATFLPDCPFNKPRSQGESPPE